MIRDTRRVVECNVLEDYDVIKNGARKTTRRDPNARVEMSYRRNERTDAFTGPEANVSENVYSISAFGFANFPSRFFRPNTVARFFSRTDTGLGRNSRRLDPLRSACAYARWMNTSGTDRWNV